MNQIIRIKRALLLHSPERYFSEIYTTDKSIIEDLSYIRRVSPSKYIVGKLLQIFLNVDEGKLKVNSYIKQKILTTIKAHTRSLPINSIEAEIREKIFKVFQKYVFFKTYSDIINSILMGITLNNMQVKWMLENHSSNKHILNRILRYPERQKMISDWAMKKHKNKAYPDRQSELVGLFITNPLQENLEKVDSAILYWGIYYAKIIDSDKKVLLKELYQVKHFDEWLVVVTKLGYFDLLENKL